MRTARRFSCGGRYALSYLDRLANGTDSDVDLYLFSVAGFPSDPCRQRTWFDRARNTRTEQILQHDHTARPPDDRIHERVYAAARGPRFEFVQPADPGLDQSGCCSPKEYGLDTRGYRVAAYLLIRVLASRRRGSLREAIKAFAAGDGSRAYVTGASEATIWRLWDEFRSAAHLGAVLLFHRHGVRADTAGMGLRTLYSPIGAGSALAWAESARIAAEQYTPPHARKPLLDPEQTWKVPPSLQLPHVQLELPSPERVTFAPYRD